ncbi:hypothetical protein HAX54_044238, partial [Datura stramonium]|nr:hypothetical protein [Datura stramonium]
YGGLNSLSFRRTSRPVIHGKASENFPTCRVFSVAQLMDRLPEGDSSFQPWNKFKELVKLKVEKKGPINGMFLEGQTANLAIKV